MYVLTLTVLIALTHGSLAPDQQRILYESTTATRAPAHQAQCAEFVLGCNRAGSRTAIKAVSSNQEFTQHDRLHAVELRAADDVRTVPCTLFSYTWRCSSPLSQVRMHAAEEELRLCLLLGACRSRSWMPAVHRRLARLACKCMGACTYGNGLYVDRVAAWCLHSLRASPACLACVQYNLGGGEALAASACTAIACSAAAAALSGTLHEPVQADRIAEVRLACIAAASSDSHWHC